MSLLAFCAKFKVNKHLNRIISSNSINFRQYANETADPIGSNAVATKAVYPPILDVRPGKKRERSRGVWHEKVKNLKTIEEKIIKVNIPKYYGYQMSLLNDHTFEYDCLPYVQHWTRTVYEDGLPKNWCMRSAEEIDQHVKSLMGPIEESLSVLFHDLR